MEQAIDLLIDFGVSFDSCTPIGSERARANLRASTETLLSLLNGHQPSAEEVEAVLPSNRQALRLGEIGISQAVDSTPLPDLDGMQRLLIEFGSAYAYASCALQHDSDGWLMTSTQLLLLLLTGEDAAPEHVEEVAPHEEALSDV